MRSGSSLLLHVLMTSPEISGCGERNRIYRDDEDLAILAIKSNLAQREKYRASHSVDQINHLAKPRKELYQDKEFNRDHPGFIEIGKLLDHGIHRPFQENYTRNSDIVSHFVNMAIDGQITVSEAVKRIDRNTWNYDIEKKDEYIDCHFLRHDYKDNATLDIPGELIKLLEVYNLK